ncbi:MAG TPA: hypothetical protein VK887_16800 [Pseudonocardiaceae bacterium]|jgi:hypothetical protein|nr:hypothetical protein [Pseudonocardiaceae bacterium]
MTIAAEGQLALPIEGTEAGADRWAGLPEQARAQVLVLLARLIARGVLIADTPTDQAWSEGVSHG